MIINRAPEIIEEIYIIYTFFDRQSYKLNVFSLGGASAIHTEWHVI